jgi:hypothetical protein
VHEDGEAYDELEMPRFFDPDHMSERMRDRMGAEGPQATELDELSTEAIAEGIREHVREALRGLPLEPLGVQRSQGFGTGLPESVVDLLRQLRSILDEKLSLGASL